MATFHTSFKFDTVVVIDSLPLSEEPQTGVWLRDSVLKPLSSEHGIRSWYYRVEAREELWAVLAEVTIAVRDVGIAPVLHFEAHGVEGGLVLANKEVIPWMELKPWLTPINRASRMNLLVVMSMCHGWHLVSQLQPVEPAPVWALIGPVHETLPARLQEAFQEFYPELLRARDGRAAIQAMNAGRAGTRWELLTETAEITFCKVWRGYEAQACTPEHLQEREDRLVAAMTRRSRYDLRFAMHGRALAKEWLASHEQRFQEYRASFLMLDTCPENEPRFQLTYKQCMDAAQHGAAPDAAWQRYDDATRRG